MTHEAPQAPLRLDEEVAGEGLPILLDEEVRGAARLVGAHPAAPLDDGTESKNRTLTRSYSADHALNRSQRNAPYHAASMLNGCIRPSAGSRQGMNCRYRNPALRKYAYSGGLRLPCVTTERMFTGMSSFLRREAARTARR